MMTVRAITVHAPWSWAIVEGLKPYENRPRKLGYRGPLLIHTGKHFNPVEYADNCDMIEQLCGRRPPAEPELGGIAGAARLVECERPLLRGEGWRGAGQYGLKLEAATVLPFRAYRGAQGIFYVELTPSETQTLQDAGLLPK